MCHHGRHCLHRSTDTVDPNVATADTNCGIPTSVIWLSFVHLSAIGSALWVTLQYLDASTCYVNKANERIALLEAKRTIEVDQGSGLELSLRLWLRSRPGPGPGLEQRPGPG